MQLERGRNWLMHAMLAVAVLCLASGGTLIVLAQRQEQLVRRRVHVLVRIDELERSFTQLHRTLATGSPPAIARLLRECDGHLGAVRDALRDHDGLPPSLLNRLREVDERTAILMRAARLLHANDIPAARSGAREAAFEAAAAVGELNQELAIDFRRSPRWDVWLALHLLVGFAALVLLLLAIAQGRVSGVLRRLYRDLLALMEGTPQVLLAVDANGNAVRWNRRFLEATALTADQLRETRLSDLFEPPARPLVIQALDLAWNEGVFEGDIPLRSAGEPKEYTWVFSRNDPNTPDSLVTIAGRDVSDRRAAERKLEITEARCHDLFARIRDAAYISQGDRIVELNPAMERMFGYSRDELMNMSTVELYETPEDRQNLIEAVARHGGAISDYAIRLRRRDGIILDCIITGTARFDEDGQICGYQGLIRDVSEKRRLEDALLRSEAEYRGLFEQAHDAILILDPATEGVLDANRRACMLYDFSHDEFLCKSMIDLSVDPDRAKQYVQLALDESGKYLPFESQQYRRDGTIVDVEIKAARVMFRGREAILSINRDVTERRRGEQRVRESEERFRLLLEGVVDYAIYMLDRSGLVISWNEGAQRITGFAEPDVIGRSFAMFYTPDQQTVCLPARDLAEAAETGRMEREQLQMRRDGTSFHAAVVLTRIVDEKGVLRGFAKITRDITARKRFEETQNEIFTAIQNVATEWTRTFDTVTVPIILLDDDGRIRRINEAAARLAGKPLKTLLGRLPEDVGGEPWKTIRKTFDFFQAHGISSDARAEDLRSGRVWQISATPIVLDGDRRVIVIAYDLTLVTQLQESLRRTEMTSALGALVAGVAHEVRNPLFTISATLDTCEAHLGGIPELQHYMAPLREEITRLNQLMQELLDYGKPQRLDLADVSLIDVAKAAIAQSRAASSRQVDVRLECDCDLPYVHGDAGRLQQALRNVIDNALQHCRTNEPVTVRLWAGAAGDLVCEVLDRGSGLSDTDLARAFVPFYTKRKGGTGLGLAIAQKFVAAHGGEITIENREGGGAVVTIHLPPADARACASS